MLLKAILYASLFFCLVPGVLVRFPANASLKTQALTHAVLFAVAAYVVHRFILPSLEGFENPSTKIDQPCPNPEMYRKCPSGDCVLKTDVHDGCPA
jgi:hypothetical protein